jgi:hypothetical protein
VRSSLFLLMACGPPVEPSVAQLGSGQLLPIGVELDLSLRRPPTHVDLRIDWGELGTDMLGRPLDPLVDVAAVELAILRGVDLETVKAGLEQGSLSQAHTLRLVLCEPVGSHCMLSDFTHLGGDVDAESFFYEDDDLRLFVLRGAPVDGLASAPMLRVMAVQAEDGAEDELLRFEDVLDNGVLSVGQAEAVPMADVLDWSTLEQDSLGRELGLHTLDRLALTRLESGTDLAAALPTLDDSPDRWELDISGRVRVDLSELEADLEMPGGWTLSLECTGCGDLVPAALFALEP